MAFLEAVPELDAALRNQFGLADRVVDEAVLASSARRFRDRRIVLPTFAQLADPHSTSPALVGDADPQAADPRNLWRVHWYNDLAGRRVAVPEHVVLPRELTGVPSPVLVVLGSSRLPHVLVQSEIETFAIRGDGEVAWRVAHSDVVKGAELVGGRLVLSSYSAEVQALDPLTGRAAH